MSDYVMVPREPTREQMQAGAMCCIRAETDIKYTATGLAVDVYTAMLAAAPATTPAADEQTDDSSGVPVL